MRYSQAAVRDCFGTRTTYGVLPFPMEGSDGTCECTDDTTTRVLIEEVKCAIRKLPFVTVLAPVRAVGDKGPGWQVSLSCSRCQEYGICPKSQQSATLVCTPRSSHACRSC